MAAQPRPDPSATALFDLLVSHRITAVLYVAARLGIADSLAEGPLTARQLAERNGAHEPSVRRLLRALVALGVCKLDDGEAFALTATGAHLAASARPSLKSWALFEGEMLSRTWGGLLDSIRTGKTAAELAGLDNAFEAMARNPEHVRMFNAAMVALTEQVTPAMLAAYDFSGITRLTDVGGGYGQLLCAILKAYPAMRGTIFDLPRCAEGAKAHLVDAGLGQRCVFTPGSFFDSVPSGADAVILKSIIHDWDDDHSIKILTNCREALAAGGKVLLVERLMPEMPEANPEHCSVILSDLNMLRGPGGCERTESEHRELMAKSGLELTRIFPAGRFSVIEAVRS
jgi:O-methyltransferase domain/Dimerisation domain